MHLPCRDLGSHTRGTGNVTAVHRSREAVGRVVGETYSFAFAPVETVMASGILR